MPWQGGAGGGVFGGGLVADALKAQGVRFVFTLTGGHISPMLVGCKMRGIRVGLAQSYFVPGAV